MSGRNEGHSWNADGEDHGGQKRRGAPQQHTRCHPICGSRNCFTPGRVGGRACVVLPDPVSPVSTYNPRSAVSYQHHSAEVWRAIVW